MKLLDDIAALPAARPRAPMLDRLGLSNKAIDERDLIHEPRRMFGKDAVPDSAELQRIKALPRRPRPTHAEQRVMAQVMTDLLRFDNPGCRCAAISPEPCITKLKPVQGWYLYEASYVRGALGHVVAGGGKTGIDCLLPMVIPGVKRAVLLLPPKLKKQFLFDFQRWSQHFRVPNLGGGNGVFYPDRPTLDLLAYTELSSKTFATWLKAHPAQLFINDEADALKDKESVRTDRYMRNALEEEQAGSILMHCFHSGSLTTQGLDDYSHLSALSLRDGSPVPLDTDVLYQWCTAINPAKKGGGAPMGALRQFCEIGEGARDGFRRRLVETPGVITTEDAEVDAKLRITERTAPPLPETVRAALAMTRNRKQRPDGEELVEALEVATVCSQLAYGFFYRWKYPRGAVRDVDGRVLDGCGKEQCGCEACFARMEAVLVWFSRRQNWFREVREKLEHRTDLLDSPDLLKDAAIRHYARQGQFPSWMDDAARVKWAALEGPTWASRAWPAWAEIAKQVEPEQDTVWIDDFLARDAAQWALEAPGIVWTLHTAFALKTAEISGLPYYGPSDSQPLNLNPTPGMLVRRTELMKAGLWERDDCEEWIKVEDGSRSIVAALDAHGIGRNLQHAFSRNLMANLPSGSKQWEQTIARTHRPGQPKPAVDVFIYLHTPEVRKALDDAREYAKYTHETTGKAERLLYAEYQLSGGPVPGVGTAADSDTGVSRPARWDDFGRRGTGGA